jgi:hypothetical protein
MKLSSALLHSYSGDGKISVDTRPLESFSSVDLEGAYDVILVQGPKSEVSIETDNNLLTHITSTVDNGKLTVSSEGILSPTKSVKVTITSPNFRTIDIEGSSDISASTPITSDDLTLQLEGAGDFNLEVHAKRLHSQIEGSGSMMLVGDAQSHSIEIDGSGDLSCKKLLADSTKIEVAGSGDADVNVSKRLQASIAGSGSVRYQGAVTDIHTSITGSGSIDRETK